MTHPYHSGRRTGGAANRWPRKRAYNTAGSINNARFRDKTFLTSGGGITQERMKKSRAAVRKL